MPSDARERMAEAIEEEMYEYADVFERALSTFTWNQGDVLVAKKEAVDNIIAHLWRMADRPEVLKAVENQMYLPSGGKMHAYSVIERNGMDGSIERLLEDDIAANWFITATLTALLGPRPKGDTDDR